EELPPLVDVPVQADGLVLGQHQDLAEVGVDAVGQGEVDDPEDPPERDRRLGPVARQRLQTTPPPPGQHGRQYVSVHDPLPDARRPFPVGFPLCARRAAKPTGKWGGWAYGWPVAGGGFKIPDSGCRRAKGRRDERQGPEGRPPGDPPPTTGH